VLAVTRNNGTSLEDAIKYLQTAASADYTHPQGSFFFASTGDVRTTARQAGFDSAVAGLRQLGLDAQVIRETMPRRQKQVAGAMLGAKTLHWPMSMSQILPGAIVDNMTSLGGRMKGDHHTLATEFLKWGAAGSSGTVVEPFSVQAKFTHPMIFVHYARGCSLAEAYYQSVQGPFQLLIVGDALCQPWAKPVEFDVVGLSPGDTITGEMRLEVKTDDQARIDHFELFLDGVRSNVAPRVGRFSFDAAKISSGHHELRIVAVAAGPLETQSRMILPFVVDHGNGLVELTADQTAIDAGGQVEFTADAKDAVGPIELRQNGRLVGTIAASGQSIRVSGSQLGAGASRLIATATIQGQLVQSVPVTVSVK
jgi:hypothetical protein